MGSRSKWAFVIALGVAIGAIVYLATDDVIWSIAALVIAVGVGRVVAHLGPAG